uniref:Predicted protein n=1 Tax=Physcomitrium patens TaxID=3218 RepID=A9U4M0_PHYPA
MEEINQGLQDSLINEVECIQAVLTKILQKEKRPSQNLGEPDAKGQFDLIMETSNRSPITGLLSSMRPESVGQPNEVPITESLIPFQVVPLSYLEYWEQRPTPVQILSGQVQSPRYSELGHTVMLRSIPITGVSRKGKDQFTRRGRASFKLLGRLRVFFHWRFLKIKGIGEELLASGQGRKDGELDFSSS